MENRRPKVLVALMVAIAMVLGVVMPTTASAATYNDGDQYLGYQPYSFGTFGLVGDA